MGRQCLSDTGEFRGLSEGLTFGQPSCRIKAPISIQVSLVTVELPRQLRLTKSTKSLRVACRPTKIWVRWCRHSTLRLIMLAQRGPVRVPEVRKQSGRWLNTCHLILLDAWPHPSTGQICLDRFALGWSLTGEEVRLVPPGL